MHDQMYEVYM